MTQFILSRHSDDDYIYSEKSQPFTAAYQVIEQRDSVFISNTEQRWHQPGPVVNGKSTIEYLREWKKPEQSWFDEAVSWEKIDERNWKRVIEDRYWCIDFNLIEQLINFCNTYQATVDIEPADQWNDGKNYLIYRIRELP